MPAVPAVCDSCSTIFQSGLFIQGGRGIFSGNKAGPCPNCGGWGHIPNGDFLFVENAIHVLNAPNRTIHELKALAKILEKARKTPNSNPEEVFQELKRELPELPSLGDQLKNVDYKFWFSILLSTIYFLIPYMTDKENKIEVDSEEIISSLYNSGLKAESPQPVSVKKIGRNEICYCGSGIKYKRCHGLN